jgi:hypothetical protein
MSDDFGAFKFLTGDVNYTDHGGKWCRHVGGRRYHVIELMNWAETVGEREAAEIGAKYNVSLREVDLTDLGDKPIRDALRSCGWEFAPENGDIECEHNGSTVCGRWEAHFDLVIVEACHGQGSAAPIWDENGNSWRKLIRAAMRESRALDNPEAHERAMSRPVNAIGSTAAEYARGDLVSPLKRGEAAGDPKASLIAKMYRNAGGRTLGGEVVDLGPAPETSGP